MIIIWDNKKQAYVLDIVRRSISGKTETIITNNPSKAFEFKEADEKKLRDFEGMLNYAEGDLEYRKVDKKSLPLEDGDFIKAERYGVNEYFLISKYSFEDGYCFALVALTTPNRGMITTDGDYELEVAEYDELFNTVEKLINNLKKKDYSNIEKVEPETILKSINDNE